MLKKIVPVLFAFSLLAILAVPSKSLTSNKHGNLVKYGYLANGITWTVTALFCGLSLYIYKEYGASSQREIRTEDTDGNGHKASKERKISQNDKKSLSGVLLPGAIFGVLCLSAYGAYQNFKNFIKISKIKLPKLYNIKNKSSKIFKIGKQYA